MPQSNPEFNEELVRRIAGIEREVQRISLLRPLFEVGNVFETTLNASQNDYDVSNYDVLLLQTSVSLNITGFSGGVRGRFLTVVKEGVNTLTLVHNSGLSNPANVIFSPSGANIALALIGAARLFYTGSYWIVTSFEV